MAPAAAPQERTKIQYAAATRKIEGKEHTITVGSVADFKGHLNHFTVTNKDYEEMAAKMEKSMGGAEKN